MILGLILYSIIALILCILMGEGSILYYLPNVGGGLKYLGLHMPQLRAIHTTFALSWIYLGANAFIEFFLMQTYPINSRPQKIMNTFKMILWGLAGALAFITLALGIFSGREYIEYHPMISSLILMGWVFFAFDLFKRIRVNFWSHPAYIYMWLIGSFLFILAYIENHLWLLDYFFARPLADMQIQWKSVGTLAGSFNLLVYGVSMALFEKLGCSPGYAKTKTAFFLLYIGLLNTFTNYTHHTYHLPQGHASKWIAFFVSMLEMIIFLKLLQSLIHSMKIKNTNNINCLSVRLLFSSKWWTVVNLFVAILISIPPINTLIHGTHVVMAHAMGSMIGINSLILLASIVYVIDTINGERLNMSRLILQGFHVSLFILQGSLILLGTINGVSRYLNNPAPAWVHNLNFLLVISGAILGLSLLSICLKILFSIRLSQKWWPNPTDSNGHNPM